MSTTLDQSLSHLARHIPGATRIFLEYGLDFCCGGGRSLREAALARGLETQEIASRLEALERQRILRAPDWQYRSPAELIPHILDRFHKHHREQLPELIRLARRVEQVHGEHPQWPRGLANQLGTLQEELESHMQKEEQILFPLLARGLRAFVQMPIQVMREEHDQHGQALERLAQCTRDFTPPPEACSTWQALYLGLKTLRADLMEHVHLENNILFETAASTHRMETSHG